MLKTKKSVSDFLMRNKMHHDQINMDEFLQKYIDEMEKGLRGVSSSLLMLPSYVRVDGLVRQNKKVIAVDAGGTNLRIALICFYEEAGCCVETVSKYRMPGFDVSIDKTEFFSILASYMEPLLGQTDTIVVSFAYPAEIMPSMDGRIIKMVKEIRINDIDGCLLGEELNKALRAKVYKEYKVYVTNDTIATCLAGMSEANSKEFDSFIGLVLGTGMNTCYTEDIENIRNKPVCGSGAMLINTESGNYNRQPRGDIDIMLDQETADAGQNTLEKMISGRYFGALLDRMIRFSEKNALFSSAFYDAYRMTDVLDTVSFAEFENGNAASVLARIKKAPKDEAILHCLFEMTAKRAAKLVTLQIAGAAIKSGKGKDKAKPICVTAEGSTFYKLEYLKDEVERLLKVWLEKDYGVCTKLICVDSAVLKGAAVAGILGDR